MGTGFAAYLVDFRRGTTTYYTIDGDLTDLEAADHHDHVTPEFDMAGVRSAISEAQQLVAGSPIVAFAGR